MTELLNTDIDIVSSKQFYRTGDDIFKIPFPDRLRRNYSD